MAGWIKMGSILVACVVTFPLSATAPVAASSVLDGSVHSDQLAEGFRDPPKEARPWVWWHWLNGNVTAEGAEMDLEWMKRIGVGGVQIFEGNLATPRLVEKPLVYMSPQWQKVFRQSVNTAKRLGIDVAVASSPGWSATGGPWVSPQAAMKKLVWSETEIRGGRVIALALRQPHDIAGPYQDVSAAALESGGKNEGARLYRDVATLAVRLPGRSAPSPVRTFSGEGPVDQAMLTDNEIGGVISLPFAGDDRAWVVQDFGRAVTLRSVTVGLPGARGFGAPPSPVVHMEASKDGVSFARIIDLPASQSQVRSASFPPTTARYFRLVLAAPSASGFGGPPGVVFPPLGPPNRRSFDISEFALSSDPRIHRVEEKAGFATVLDYYKVSSPTDSKRDAVVHADIIDLRNYVGADGKLRWKAPAGRWRLLRIGYSLTGKHNGPAPDEATGLEVDKLNAKHVRDYAEYYLDMYAKSLGGESLDASGLEGLLSDSIEAGPQNWTENMSDEFERRRGYSLTRWLPALTGIVIGSAKESDKFLWDFRQTISELLAENHYGVLADVAKARGLDYYSEALEDHRPQLGDDLEMRRFANVPMGAMWMIPPGGKPNPTYVADLKGAASVAHVYGRKFVGAESLTAFGQPFGFSPRDLKSTIDLEFALGVTRPILHTSAHQPFATGHKPGMALATILGQYFTRNETWADQAKVWTDYLARSSYLLQQGRPVSDIAYFAGEEAPITALYGDTGRPVLPSGYDFDFIGRDALFHRVNAKDGALVTPEGVRYEVLVLGGSSTKMTLSTLRRVESFAKAGVAVVGRKPLESPSLSDDAQTFAQLASQLWDQPGLVFPNVEAALADRQIAPDWDAGVDNDHLAVIHRRLDDGDLYFLSNRAGRPLDTRVRFRVDGKMPELWRADTGQIELPSWQADRAHTAVSLKLGIGDAVFVIFRRPTSASGAAVSQPKPQLLQEITGLWTIGFSTEGQVEQKLRTEQLESWSNSPIPAIRYFSGTATYSRSLEIPAAWLEKNRKLQLDLGDVRELAEVWLNGKLVATSWHPPFRVDISKHLRPGTNRLEVKVVNLWVNRLIGDAQPGAVPVTFTQAPTYTPDAPLRPSGLLGPVTLWTE